MTRTPSQFSLRDRIRARRLSRRRAVQGVCGLAATMTAGMPMIGRAQDASPVASPAAVSYFHTPLWQTALGNRIVFGTSLATWQAEDAEYLPLVDHEAAVLFTEDDLLWYKLRPTPDAELDFTFSDQFYDMAEAQSQLVFGAHLVWDEGFGEGWTEDDLWGLDQETARRLLFDTLTETVTRYKGRTAGWIVVNEVIDAHEDDGLRRDYPWYETLGGHGFVAEAFHAAHEADPDALLVLNEFGFETDDEFDSATDKQERALRVIDGLLDEGAPVHAFGIQAHLFGADFASRFDAEGYRQFLDEIADRGLQILITEMDVLDDGLPVDAVERDAIIADMYGTYLDVALAETAVGALITFGLTDRYTWLQEDYPREDGTPRRPLPYDEDLQQKPAYAAIEESLDSAPSRGLLWRTLRDNEGAAG
jgi:endo-1,4-beta-xylanase